jgi:hypothetical protein
MNAVTIRCEHTAKDIHLRVSQSNMCCIQCGLIQIVLSPTQAARVRHFCHCMPAKLQYEGQNNQGRATMTVDPSQVDLRGKRIGSWLIG